MDITDAATRQTEVLDAADAGRAWRPARRRSPVAGSPLRGLAGRRADADPDGRVSPAHQDDPSDHGSESDATTDDRAPTTTRPDSGRPTDDVALLGFAQSVELARPRPVRHRARRRRVRRRRRGGRLERSARHHEAYGQAISGLIGRQAPERAQRRPLRRVPGRASPATPPRRRRRRPRRSRTTPWQRTLDVLGQLVGIDGAGARRVDRSCVEARHATVLARPRRRAPTSTAARRRRRTARGRRLTRRSDAMNHQPLPTTRLGDAAR